MSDSNQSKGAVLIGLVIGLVSFVVLFGLERALGTGDAYRWPAGDQAQHIAGAFAYLDGKWSWPLFMTDRINHPDGVNIIYTDSAPFAGFVAKIVDDVTGFRFNYLGAWFFVLWTGQAAAGAYLARQLGLRHPIYYACAALFALAAPAFLNRHFHLALGSHFLLLAALGLYFRTARSSFSLRIVLVWALLLWVAIWTHAYLFAMAFAIFAVAYGDAARRKLVSVGQAALAVGAVSVWCMALALTGGYQTASNIAAIGYGAFRLDVLAFAWPHMSAIFQAPLIFTPESAFEGFNYLGLGGLLAILAAVFLFRPRQSKDIVQRHLLLAICLAGMLVFALTNNVAVAGRQILFIPMPIDGFPFSTFRASGRFGWPIGYLAVFVALALVLRAIERRSRNAALVVAAILTVVQLGDSAVLFHSIQHGWRSTPKPLFEAAIFKADSVSFQPPIDCISDVPMQTAAIEVLEIAARAGKVADSAHTARAIGLDCSKAPQPAPVGTVLVVAPGTPAATFYQAAMQCREEAGLLLCTRRDKT